MIKKLNFAFFSSMILINACIANEQNKVKSTHYLSIDIGAGALHCFGHEPYMPTGVIDITVYGAEDNEFATKVLLNMSYGSTSSDDFYNKADDYADIITEIGADVVDATFDDFVGVHIYSKNGMKDSAYFWCAFFGQNMKFCPKKSDRNSKREYVFDYSVMNVYVGIGSSYEIIEYKKPLKDTDVSINRNKWNQSKAIDILFGICVDGIFINDSMSIVPSISVLAQLNGKTIFQGFDATTDGDAVTNGKRSINEMILDRKIYPTVLADVKFLFDIHDEIFFGITPFMKLSYRAMRENNLKLSKFAMYADGTGEVKGGDIRALGDILENNILLGLYVSILYIK